MKISLIFIIFFIGTIFASAQDFKRREIDRWLTYILLVSGIFYLLVNIIVNKDVNLLVQGVFVYFVMFLLTNLMYYSKFFAGGDANLLFSISALFVGQTFLISILNIITFLAVLFICGSIYGVIYSSILYFKNARNVNVELKKGFKESKLNFMIIIGLILSVLSFFNVLFLPFAVILVLTPPLFVFVRALEKVVLVKKIRGIDLRVGDWLRDDVVIDDKRIKSTFYGVSQEEIDLLRNKKEIYIKDGLPFAPVFCIALIGSLFIFEGILAFIFQLFI